MIALVAWLALSASAPLDPPPLLSSNGQNWGVVGARTAGQSGNLVEAGLGFPGVHVSYLRGISPRFDLGLRAGFNYAHEGLVTNPLSGIKAQFLLHYKFYDANQVSVAFSFEPGPLFYFAPNGCFFDGFGNRVCTNDVISGFAFPLGIRLGLAASSAVNVGVTFDVPLWLNFGKVNTVQLPVLIGAGIEYFVRSNLLLYFAIKMGPTLYTAGAPAVFTFDANLGVGVRF